MYSQEYLAHRERKYAESLSQLHKPIRHSSEYIYTSVCVCVCAWGGGEGGGAICVKSNIKFQAFHEMPRYFNHFMKCPIELVISENDYIF